MKIHSQPVLPPPPPLPPVRAPSTGTVAAAANLWVPISPSGAVASKSRTGASGTKAGGQRTSSATSGAASALNGTVSTKSVPDASVPYTRGSLIDILT